MPFCCLFLWFISILLSYLFFIDVSRYVDMMPLFVASHLVQMKKDVLQQLKAVADPSRIRILRSLSVEPLHVSELLDVLDMGQSRVSRHLRILADAGLVAWRRDGSRIYYRIDSNLRNRSLWSVITDEAMYDRNFEQLLLDDRERLSMVLESRKAKSLVYFDDVGSRQDEDQQMYVDADYYRSRILELLPDQVGVCLEPGCGTGILSNKLKDKASRLILVDQSRRMLKAAEQTLVHHDGTEFRVGYMEHLPLADEEVDTVVLSMALHHSADPSRVIQEVYRVLRPGGVFVIADLKKHSEEDMRRLFEDFWLGFDVAFLRQELDQVGFDELRISEGKGDGRLSCVFVTARKSVLMKQAKPKLNRQTVNV